MAPKEDKRLLYVGGLADEVVEETLHAAFIPFGEVKEVNMPRDHQAKDTAHRGFAFVAFEHEEDADEARFNMNGSELFGRVLRVNVARAAAHKLGSCVDACGARFLGVITLARRSKPVWSADEWFQNLHDTAEGADAAAPPASAVPPPGGAGS